MDVIYTDPRKDAQVYLMVEKLIFLVNIHYQIIIIIIIIRFCGFS